MPVEKYILGSPTLLVNNLSLSNYAGVHPMDLDNPFDNTEGQVGNGYTLCDLEATITINTSTPNLGTSVNLWFLMSQNGTTYEDGSSTVVPARTPDVVFPFRQSNSTQIVNRRVFMPWGIFRPLVRNESDSTITISISVRPVSHQSV